MEKVDKKKVLAVVLIISLIAALGGAVSLFYNSIDMFTNTTFYIREWDEGLQQYIYFVSDAFKNGQQPLAIITLVAALTAFGGVAAGISSFIVKKTKLKKISLIVCLVAMIAFVIFIIAARCVWTGLYKDYVEDALKDLYPYYLPLNVTITSVYAIYSGVMAVLIPELVYFALIAAALVITFKINKKEEIAEKAATETVASNDINSEKKGE